MVHNCDQSVAGLRGPTSKGREGKEEEEMGRDRREGEELWTLTNVGDRLTPLANPTIKHFQIMQ